MCAYKLADGSELDASKLMSGDVGVEEMGIGVLLIVDDTTLVADDVVSLQKGLKLVYEQFRRFGMGVNVTKSFALAFAAAESTACGGCGSQSLAGKKGSMAICDGCDGGQHTQCMSSEARVRWDSVEGTSAEWLCDVCDGLEPEERVSSVKPPLEMGDGTLEWRKKDKYLGVVQSETCELDIELSARIRCARAAFERLRPLVLFGRPTQHMRAVYARVFTALTTSVLLYGGECWALSTGQLERLEVAQRVLLRAALPARLRRWRAEGRNCTVCKRVHGHGRMCTVALMRYFGVSNVATLLARRQLRFIGHVARMPEDRVQRRLLRCWRMASGRGRHGPPTMLTGLGGGGVFKGLLDTYLTVAVKRDTFGVEGRDRPCWTKLAQSKKKWKEFVGGVKVKSK